jgi:hypothetical protein
VEAARCRRGDDQAQPYDCKLSEGKMVLIISFLYESGFFSKNYYVDEMSIIEDI